MAYWILTVKKWTVGAETHTGEEIFNLRMKDGFWGLNEKTPNRKNLKENDSVTYYVGARRDH